MGAFTLQLTPRSNVYTYVYTGKAVAHIYAKLSDTIYNEDAGLPDMNAGSSSPDIS